MDQNSSNDTEKRNWRERLGIGTKEMPKIASEFSKPGEPVLVVPPARAGDKADGQPVVVAKPAPMAPRVSSKPAAAKPVPASERSQRSPQPSATAARPMQPGPPQAPDVLAERLRNQREAAEKLAEQRVSNAKERAEASKIVQQQVIQPPQQSASPAAPPSGQRGRPDRGKPKFTFAEEDVRADAKRDPRPMPAVRPPAAQPGAMRPGPQPQAMQPQMTPARPPLGGGGDRFVNPQAPPPTRPVAQPAAGGPGFAGQPQYRPQPPGPGYRPIDPATGYVPPPSFQMPRGTMAPPPGPRPAAMPAGMSGDPRLQSGPYISDPYAPPLPSAGGLPRYENMGRAAPPPLRTEHLRPQTHNYEGDIQDDIFEDGPAKPLRRASPNDYSQAYHPDADMDYAQPRRRSGGPLILLMLLGVAAAVGIGGVLYYQNMLKSGSAPTADAPPVVPAPVQPDKTTTENNNPAPANTTAAQPSKKQIYDRIIGDKEVLGGQMTPTEEAPVQPAADQATQPAPLPQPASGAAEEPLPLPMPPPVNGNTQGNAGNVAQPLPSTQTETAAAEPIPAPQPPANTTVTATGYTSEQQQQMAAASQQKTVIQDQPAAAAPDPAPEEVAEPPQTTKPAVKPKAAAKPKPKKKIETASAKKLGSEPVVLVPDQNAGDNVAVTQDPAIGAEGDPPLQQGAVATEQPVKKKKTLLGLFTGENKRIDQQGEATGIDAATEQQVASANTRQQTPQVTAPAEQPQAAKTGFTLQLASFPSEQEARAEYQRVSARHSNKVAGLSPIITPVSVGGSTRYRLSLGTVSSSQQAQSLCKDLAAAGLRDCVVRRR